jgi:hypothetical protein
MNHLIGLLDAREESLTSKSNAQFCGLSFLVIADKEPFCRWDQHDRKHDTSCPIPGARAEHDSADPEPRSLGELRIPGPGSYAQLITVM